MKICIINNLLPPFQRGGADRIAYLILNGLKQEGYEVFSISAKPYFSKEKNKNTEENTAYYVASLFFMLNKIPKILRLVWHIADMFDLKSYFTIKKILIREKPNVVITNNLKGVGFLIPSLLKKLKIKHIHIIHDIQLIHPSGLMIFGNEKIIRTPFAKLYSYISTKLFNSPEIIISPSKWLMDLHEENNFFLQSKKIILPNPVNPRITSAKEKNSKFTLLYVGELEIHKGIELLVSAFKELNNNFYLKIIGNGSQMEKIKKYNLNNVEFLGWQNNEQVQKEMRQADCLIMPSLCYENSPTVIYEAVNSGLPVISSRIGGATELIHFLGGLLFSPNNKNDLIKKINWVKQNYNTCLATTKKAQDRIKSLELSQYIAKIKTLI